MHGTRSGFIALDDLDVDLSQATARWATAWAVALYVAAKGYKHPVAFERDAHVLQPHGAANITVLEHRHSDGNNACVRLDVGCAGCKHLTPAYVHQEYILPFVDSKYVGYDELFALDPDDPRRLPDGSAWVDAAALAIVARSTLGGSP
jgi:hypothetical protein